MSENGIHARHLSLGEQYPLILWKDPWHSFLALSIAAVASFFLRAHNPLMLMPWLFLVNAAVNVALLAFHRVAARLGLEGMLVARKEPLSADFFRLCFACLESKEMHNVYRLCLRRMITLQEEASAALRFQSLSTVSIVIAKMVCVWILGRTFTLSTLAALSMPLVLTIPKLYVEHGRCLASSRLCGSVRKYGRQKEVKTERRKK